MLYLAPPYYMINRVSVFRDHEDPLQWYYLPAPPRLTEVTDEQTGVSVPQLQVIQFRSGPDSGGFLNFDVNLGVDPDVLEEIRDEIKRSEHLRESPRLAPVPLIDGTVKLMLFDKQTAMRHRLQDRRYLSLLASAITRSLPCMETISRHSRCS
ncbi:hypothetical protein [Cohnella faecalis]|uniref:Uncharacterized protein n=1 Tax=Cohnella faecalis TaxID=2315694 RepID=A0A398CFE1_9BACL|nr:hypothetical protein [Cohnella faecalis]RIE00612.1 hypothetical protein D3H35_27520 [Cohnella faecalis]